MAIALEIERKFLLKDLPNVIWDKVYNISQSYCEKNGEKCRVRERHDSLTNKWQFFKTIKKKIENGVYEENEEEITVEMYTDYCMYEVNRIKKKRYIKEDDNKLTWEVDDYGKLIVAEVELEDIEQKIEMPEYISSLLIMEVTQFPEFTNHKLAKLSKNCFYNLYKEWQNDIMFHSSLHIMMSHKNVDKIVNYMKSDISFLEEAIEDLKRTNNVCWFGVLREATGANPVKNENLGYVVEMTKDWVNWYLQNVKWKISN